MTVVLDCNIIVMCLSSRSPYHIIYQALTSGKFQIIVDTEIILEYEEIIQKKYGTATANAFIALLKELPNVRYIISYYKWLLIDTDPDDNKYVDCYIAGKAEWLVTEDQHFNALKTVSFPPVTTLSIDDFMAKIQSL
jgi:putative PIN family toxin of toxin-antitoxin system